MPVTLTAPVAQPTVSKLDNLHIHVEIENSVVYLSADQTDSAGTQVGPVVRVTMSWAAFIAAIQAASGTAKQKPYNVLLAQLGLSGTVT